MTLTSRIKESAIKVTIILLILLGTVVYSSVQAQRYTRSDYASITYNNHLKNTGASVKIGSDINVNATPVELQNAINSPYDDIKPRLAPDGKRMYFSRTFHPGNINGVMDPEDIWYSDFDENSNTWSEPIHLAGFLNNAGPNYINNISPTGDTLILGNQYLKKGKMRAGLSYSVNVNGEWSMPTPIDIENDYNISHHSNSFVSLRNGVIIRAVQRTETEGGRDLYVSFWNGEKATEPVNMGTVINSEFEESSPFLAPDNKTMYFASKGHSGHGGYDIFMTKRLDDSWINWSTPENLGPAVNGPMDDEFFSITNCGKYAIFSKQVNVHNTDLFRISLGELFGKTMKNNSPALEDSALAAL